MNDLFMCDKSDSCVQTDADKTAKSFLPSFTAYSGSAAFPKRQFMPSKHSLVFLYSVNSIKIKKKKNQTINCGIRVQTTCLECFQFSNYHERNLKWESRLLYFQLSFFCIKALKMMRVIVLLLFPFTAICCQ